jgi:hypothetical protein
VVDKAGGTEGDLGEHERARCLVLVDLLGGAGSAELGVDAEDVVDPAQVRERVGLASSRTR